MTEKNTFLSDLGAEMRALFNSKITDWSLTSPIDWGLDTEGVSKFHLSDFERLEKLLELPVQVKTAFIPNDLFDFDATKEDVAEDPTSNTKRQIAKSADFSSNNKPIRKDVLLEKKDVFLQNSIFDSIKGVEKEKDFKEIGTENTFDNIEKASKMPDILRGGMENILDENQELNAVPKPQIQRNAVSNVENKPKSFEKSVFLERETSQNEPKSFDKSVFSKSETTQKVTTTTLDTSNSTAAPSIWQNPLGGLGAFAALSHNTIPIPTNKPINNAFSPAYQIYEAEREADLEVKTGRVGAQQKQQPFENDTSTMEKKPEQNEQDVSFFDTTYFEKKQPRYLENAPENADFIPIEAKEQPNDFNTTTLTDDLFDALTERVRRDFKRFYP
jgi:hypothetical protein